MPGEHLPEVEADSVPTDVGLTLYFGTGYTLDQLGATLDALDTLFNAGFVAAEAKATRQPLGSVYERLLEGSPAFELTWMVDSIARGPEAGCLMRIWSASALTRERLDALAAECAVTIDGFEEGPSALR